MGNIGIDRFMTRVISALAEISRWRGICRQIRTETARRLVYQARQMFEIDTVPITMYHNNLLSSCHLSRQLIGSLILTEYLAPCPFQYPVVGFILGIDLWTYD